MAQRTVFPALPNTTEVAYIATLDAFFGHLARSEGQLPFKKMRSFLKERNVYDKEDYEELCQFLGCVGKPDTILGDFGRKYLACESIENRQEALFLWLNAWNHFLPKYIFDALDVEGGGRLHSTHELYRLVTSYVYAGEYITLVNFQNWIKWMAATGYIKYIGIRWGLSEKGKEYMPKVRQIDVDELLEDEEEEREAAEAVEAAAQTPTVHEPPSPADLHAAAVVPEPPAPAPLVAPTPAPVVASAAPIPAPVAAPALPEPEPVVVDSPEDDLEEDFPDMPAAAPLPVWDEPEPAEPALAPAPVVATGLGLDPAEYARTPQLFLYKAVIASRLATEGHAPEDWQPLFQFLAGHILEPYFNGDKSLEHLIGDTGWFAQNPAWRPIYASVALDVMRARAQIKSRPKLSVVLEEAGQIGTVVWQLHKQLFDRELSAAPLWLVHTLVGLGVWDNPGY